MQARLLARSLSAKQQSTFNAHSTARPGPTTSDCLASRLAATTKDLMNIDTGTGQATGHLDCLNGNVARARPIAFRAFCPPDDPAGQCQLFTHPLESGGDGRNMESRRPEDSRWNRVNHDDNLTPLRADVRRPIGRDSSRHIKRRAWLNQYQAMRSSSSRARANSIRIPPQTVGPLTPPLNAASLCQSVVRSYGAGVSVCVRAGCQGACGNATI